MPSIGQRERLEAEERRDLVQSSDERAVGEIHPQKTPRPQYSEVPKDEDPQDEDERLAREESKRTRERSSRSREDLRDRRLRVHDKPRARGRRPCSRRASVEDLAARRAAIAEDEDARDEREVDEQEHDVDDVVSPRLDPEIASLSCSSTS